MERSKKNRVCAVATLFPCLRGNVCSAAVGCSAKPESSTWSGSVEGCWRDADSDVFYSQREGCALCNMKIHRRDSHSSQINPTHRGEEPTLPETLSTSHSALGIIISIVILLSVQMHRHFPFIFYHFHTCIETNHSSQTIIPLQLASAGAHSSP